MTLYFENPLNFHEPGIISTNGAWHPNAPLLAVASYSQEKGGFVNIFDELGEPLPDISYPYHPVHQVTALIWHPERNILATGWENGDLKVWSGDREFAGINGPHKSPITLLEFSEKGGRLVSCDAIGNVVGWKVDTRNEIAVAFHHDLKEPLTHLTFRQTVKTHPDYDVQGLARAAVNGDAQALDLFSQWRPKTTARKFRVQDGTDNLCFFVGTQNGTLFYINQSGICIEVLNTEGSALTHVLYHPIKDALIVMMEGLTVGHFQVDYQGHLMELSKVKLSGRAHALRGAGNQGLIWASQSSLAILTGELIIRIWNIDTNDNYVLPITLKNYGTQESSKNLNETFTCISYSKMNQTLCAGTNVGRIYFWTRRSRSDELPENPEESWQLSGINAVSGTVKQVMWGSASLRLPLISVNCVTRVYIMKEQTISTCFSPTIWAIQRSASQVLLQTHNKGDCLVNLEIQVTDMSINRDHIAFSNGRMISVHDIVRRKQGMDDIEVVSDSKIHSAQAKSSDIKKDELKVNLINNFNCDNERILMYGKHIAILFVTGVTIKSANGMTVAQFPTTSTEGEPIGMDICGDILTIFTLDGFLKLYSLSDQQNKLIVPVKYMYDVCPDFGEIIQAKTNSAGSIVALTIAAANLIPDGKLYIWDLEKDQLINYDFKKEKKYRRNLNGQGEADPDEAEIEGEVYEGEDGSGDKAPNQFFDRTCANRVPLTLNWDMEDTRLLVCSARKLKTPKSSSSNNGDWRSQLNIYKIIPKDLKQNLIDEDQILVTMFVSSEFGIKMHDIRPMESDARLISVATPYIVSLKKMDIAREVMNDFAGLEGCNKVTRDAVLEFSYNLSLGNMDLAFKAIKLVQSAGVWNSLARMCVKTRRLDVASVCLGHMGNANAARLLRLAVNDETLPIEAKVAVLAIQLDMIEEAEQLYIECNRYDLLNKLNQYRGKLPEALEIARTKDRIHLRNTEYIWAKHLEREGNFKDAITHYEQSNTHRYEVPRMLIEQPDQLVAYVSKSNDPEILKWWGQYVESQGDMAAALKIYANSADIYSQVRVLCFLGEETRASDLARSGNDKAAFYHMARHYETVGNTDQAVAFFNRANAYSNAVRLCKESHMGDELWGIGIIAGNREKLECARYFEETGSLDKAVILYHRAGMLHKALDIAFKTQQFDTLQQIANDLDQDSDPAIVNKCAEYFVMNEQYDKAVDLLAIGKRYTEAISVSIEHNVQLNEELAEKLSPEKDEVSETERINILELLAESLMSQGEYHLACKKFTQAGNKIRGIKALLKSGDTDKIIFFASVSRQKEIYIMAANYLQSLDWQNQPEILKNIILFYSKGKALDLLANFYVACAQVEIDEFQNYEKAFGAMTEAARALGKVTSPRDANQHRRANEIVQQRLTYVKRFVDIRRLLERGDIQTGLTQCRQLLTSAGDELESSVRRGDIYAIMIQVCVGSKQFQEGKVLLDELRQLTSQLNNVPITYYVNKETMEGLARGLGVSVQVLSPILSQSTTTSLVQGGSMTTTSRGGISSSAGGGSTSRGEVYDEDDDVIREEIVGQE